MATCATADWESTLETLEIRESTLETLEILGQERLHPIALLESPSPLRQA